MALALSINVRKKLRDFSVDVDLSIENNIAILLGPSGHGKTTLLNMIAGITRPDRGSISIGDVSFFDSRDNINVEMQTRNIGYVFQDYALFPHLSVFENVAFGLRARGLSAPVIKNRVTKELERLAIEKFKDEKPSRLSAGQRQRVALARALVIEPCLILMDEPLSALDMQLRSRVRSELKILLRRLNIPTLIVTHDALDAMALGDVVMVMEQGRIVQRGTYESLLANPSSRFVADFVQSNVYAGYLKEVDKHGDAIIALTNGVEIYAVMEGRRFNAMSVVIHPWDIVLLKTNDDIGSIRNVLKGTIIGICSLHDRVRVMVDAGIQITAEISRPSLSLMDLKEGGEVYAAFKTTAIRLFPIKDNEEEGLREISS